MRWNQHSLPIKSKTKDAHWTRTQNATVLRRRLLCLFCIIGVSSCVKRHWWDRLRIRSRLLLHLPQVPSPQGLPPRFPALLLPVLVAGPGGECSCA